MVRALCVIDAGLLLSKTCYKRFQALDNPAPRMGSATMAFNGKFVYIAHHFILLWRNPFDFSVDREQWGLEHSVLNSTVCLSADGAKIVFWHWLSSSTDGGV